MVPTITPTNGSIVSSSGSSLPGGGDSMSNINNSSNPTTTTRKGSRRNRRVLVWLLGIVVLVVVVMMIEDETELRQADDLSTTTSRSSSSSSKKFVGRDDSSQFGAMYGMSGGGSSSKNGKFKTTDSTSSSYKSYYDKYNRDTEMVRKSSSSSVNRMDDDLFTYFKASRTTGGQNSNGLSSSKSRSGNNHKSTKTKDKKTTKGGGGPGGSNNRFKKKFQPFPVINYDDDTIPQGVAGSVIHAADALLCRDTVIDYVINATDLKDECDGLKKAFTKTCADDQQQQQQQQTSAADSAASFTDSTNPDESSSTTTTTVDGGTTVSDSTAKDKNNGSPSHRRRRRLSNDDLSSNPVKRWQHHLYRLSRYIRRQSKRLITTTTTTFMGATTRRSSSSTTMFMAEDAVMEEWEDASIDVEQGWDWRYRTDEIQSIYDWVVKETLPERLVAQNHSRFSTPVMKKRNTAKGRRKLSSNYYLGREHRRTEEEKEESDSEDLVPLPQEQQQLSQQNMTSSTVPPKKDSTTMKDGGGNKHMANLALPTNVKHVSEKMLSETLMLQQDNKLMKAVQNHTNHTVSEAQADAAASAKAVSDANDFVSSVLNDPTSVEARTCCTSILNVFHENCNVEPEEELSDSRLFVAILVIAVCGLVKSLIRHFAIRWLPEAAGCILVGVSAGYFLTFYPHHDISFDGKWFLRIMVPPIVFEAALSIDKRSFNRHVVPILIYAIVGTLMASGITAVVLHEGSTYFRGLCETIPYPEALTFGALISSIDPIAVLSVLSNMGMSDVDTIYVVIFGESLLNDGVAIVLFQTLVHFLDDNMDVDSHAVGAAAIHFLVVFLGSFLIGVASGLCCTVYYWLMHGCQTPLVEVLMFCCWALFPYYVCDGIEWSGIVSVVAAGFVMDIFVVGTHFGHESVFDIDSPTASDLGLSESLSDVSDKGSKDRRRRNNRVRRPILSRDGLLSVEAKTHIGFVTEIIATMMETAIFAYLGLFLFSSRYHWNFYHVFIAISGCCISRAIMIPTLSLMANWITRLHQFRERRRQHLTTYTDEQHAVEIRKAPGVIIDRKMQLVLWFAGLRGAMSFALVEDIPLYDAVTGEGTRLKSELKAMTSASIIFTVFVLGGATFYMMDFVGLAPKNRRDGYDMNGTSGNNKHHQSMLEREMEMIGLLSRSHPTSLYDKEDGGSGDNISSIISPSNTLSDDDGNPPDMYSQSAGSQSTYESRAGGNAAPRRVNRPGTFRRQRQTHHS